MHYLLKTEPSTYSFADLQKEHTTLWDGVSNPQALKFMREMKKGDRLIIYHTGAEKSAVGTASVVSVEAAEGRPPEVRIKAGHPLRRAVSLAEIKAHQVFRDSPLLRQGRLSVVPLTEAQYRVLAGE